MIHTIRQFEFVTISTNRACLRSVSGINSNTFSTGPFYLVLNELKELSPRYISDRAIYAAKIVFFHIVDRKILNADGVKFIYDLPGFLMSKISTFPGCAFMNMSNNFSSFCTKIRSFGLLGEFVLRFGKRLLFVLEKSWVLDLNSIGSCGERLKSHVQSDSGFNRLFNWFMIHNTGKSNIPFSGWRTFNGAGLDCAFNRPVEFNFNISDFGKLDGIIEKFKSELGVSEAVIAKFSSESWISRLFVCFTSAKESTKRKINSCGYILKRLAVNIVQERMIFFEVRNGVGLVVSGKDFLFGFPRVFALFEKMIVKPATSVKRSFELFCLALIRKKPILKSFSHVIYTIYIILYIVNN